MTNARIGNGVELRLPPTERSARRRFVTKTPTSPRAVAPRRRCFLSALYIELVVRSYSSRRGLACGLRSTQMVRLWPTRNRSVISWTTFDGTRSRAWRSCGHPIPGSRPPWGLADAWLYSCTDFGEGRGFLPHPLRAVAPVGPPQTQPGVRLKRLMTPRSVLST